MVGCRSGCRLRALEKKGFLTGCLISFPHVTLKALTFASRSATASPILLFLHFGFVLGNLSIELRRGGRLGLRKRFNFC